MKVQGLVHHLGTHESQKAPEETQTEALDFMDVIPLLAIDPVRINKKLFDINEHEYCNLY